MLNTLMNAGLFLGFALVLAWMIVTVTTGTTLIGMF